MPVLATATADSVADQQAVRDWFCSKLEILRPEAQAGITVTINADSISIDGVRSSSLAIVQSIADESNTTQAVWINGKRYHKRVQTAPPLLRNSRTKQEKYYDVIAQSLKPEILRELEQHSDWPRAGFFGIGPNLRKRTEVEPFPFPPPEPSAVLELPRPRPATTVDDLVQGTRDNLAAAGYSYSTVSSLPNGGVAVVAPLEQIDTKGNPLRGNARWSPTIEPVTSGGIRAYLKALIAGRKGYWRVIAFVITDKPLPIGPQPTVAQLGGFQRGGSLSLAPSDHKETITLEHHVWAFIYEIFAQENEEEPTVVVPGRISATEHLKRAGLYWGRK